MKKKKIFVNKITNKTGNNQKVFEVNEDNFITNNDLISTKLNKLFSINGYVFNVDVMIITNDKTYNTKIASWVGNNIITMDNDVIPIKEIKDIIF